MADALPINLEKVPVHLGLGARVTPQAPFTDSMEWYDEYAARTESDGVEGRLVCIGSYDTPWNFWEMHPSGDELVVCIEGTMTLHQEIDGAVTTTVLSRGEATINPKGVWHTADANSPTTALYVTAGVGTEHRPR